MWKFLMILSIFAVSHGCKVQLANGIESSRENHPSHVLLEIFPSFDMNYLCSGVLVSDKFVLTASTCMIGLYSPDSFINVHVYANDLRDVFEANREIYRTSQFHLLPGYNGFSWLNDLALVELPVSLNIAAKPYAIARIPNLNDQFTVGREGKSVGWGLLDYGLLNNGTASKQEQTMQVISDAECRTAFLERWEDETVYGGRVCIRRAAGNNCVSDVGSPFMIGDIVYGIQSFGQVGACKESLPNGIQEVRYHSEWIASIIS